MSKFPPYEEEAAALEKAQTRRAYVYTYEPLDFSNSPRDYETEDPDITKMLDESGEFKNGIRPTKRTDNAWIRVEFLPGISRERAVQALTSMTQLIAGWPEYNRHQTQIGFPHPDMFDELNGALLADMAEDRRTD